LPNTHAATASGGTRRIPIIMAFATSLEMLIIRTLYTHVRIMRETMILFYCPICRKETLILVVRTVPKKQKWELSYGSPTYFCTAMAFCSKCGKYLGWN